MTRRSNDGMARHGLALVSCLMLAGTVGTADAQSGVRGGSGGQRSGGGQRQQAQPQQSNPQSQPASNPNRTTTQPSQPSQPTNTNQGTRGTRAPSGTRAPGGGVRAPGGGVRAPGGGVRGPGTPGVGPRGTPSTPPGDGVPVIPGDGHDGPGDGHHHYCFPYYGWGWGWGNYWGWGWYTVPERYAGTVDGPNNGELQPPQEEEAEPLTPLESARAWMYYGKTEAAAEWYREHLAENPDHARVMREYAAALLESGRTVDAVAMMGYAYSLMPGLANEAMDPGLWGDSAFRLRDSVTDAVRFGHRSSSGNAWLLVAVLMQAEGRDTVALKMIDRAVGEGLDAGVADRMRLRLTQR